MVPQPHGQARERTVWLVAGLMGLTAACGPAPTQRDANTTTSWKLSRERVARQQAKQETDFCSDLECHRRAASRPWFADACPAADQQAPVRIAGEMATRSDFEYLRQAVEGSAADRAALLAELLTQASGSCAGADVVRHGDSVALVLDQPCGDSGISGRIALDVSRPGAIGLDLDLKLHKLGNANLQGHFDLTESVKPRTLCVTGKLAPIVVAASGNPTPTRRSESPRPARQRETEACRMAHAVTTQRLLLFPIMPWLLFSGVHYQGLCR